MSTRVPPVDISFPVGDTSIAVVDLDNLRTWLRHYHTKHENDIRFQHALDLVAELFSVEDYLENDGDQD